MTVEALLVQRDRPIVTVPLNKTLHAARHAVVMDCNSSGDLIEASDILSLTSAKPHPDHHSSMLNEAAG